MKIFKILFIVSILTVWSCQPDANDQIKGKSLSLKSSNGKISLSNQLTVTLEKGSYDSIYFPGIQPVLINANSYSFQFESVGRKKVNVWAMEDGKWRKGHVNVEVYSNFEPVALNYEIIETYEHNSESYTQGLEFYEGYLYESTGRNGKSRLIKYQFPEFKELNAIRLNLKYFGEGISILRDTIYQLTWQSKKVLTYDLDLNRLDQLELPNNEGWGMCNDGEHLWISDGSHYLIQANSKMKPVKRQAIYSGASKMEKLNELEYLDGKIWANLYYSDVVVQLDPEKGTVLATLDLSELRNQISFPRAEVLNGIAYLEEKDAFLVTGKLWEKSFLIKIKE